MLQYITKENDEYSIAEQVQMAIEGGCRWIQFSPGDMDDGQIRETAAEIVPLCLENEVFMTIENRADMARELGLHGVHITDKSISAPAMRDQLGAEAIIGVEVTTPQAVLAMQGADIDYATVSVDLDDAQAADLIAAANGAGNRMPLVMHANSVERAKGAVAMGANGIAADTAVLSAPDPVDAIARLLTVKD